MEATLCQAWCIWQLQMESNHGIEKKVKRKHDRHAHLELLIEGNIYVGINIHAQTQAAEKEEWR